MDEGAEAPNQTNDFKGTDYSERTDFSVMGSLDTSINIEGIQTVEVHCYCETGFKRNYTLDGMLNLKVIGTESGVGYHGVQEAQVDVSDKLLSFKETRIGSTLKLESREYRYIHHAYFIDHLEISAPHGIDIALNRIEGHELQRRDNN